MYHERSFIGAAGRTRVLRRDVALPIRLQPLCPQSADVARFARSPLRDPRSALQRPHRDCAGYWRLHLRAGARVRRRLGRRRIARHLRATARGRERRAPRARTPRGPDLGVRRLRRRPARGRPVPDRLPAVRDTWKSPSDRALYVLVKERKFGAGCVSAWEQRPTGARRARTKAARSLARDPGVPAIPVRTTP